jgi:tRNA (guanine37-N1)-methyltransferase
MGEPLEIDIITIFPVMLECFLEESILKRAVEKGSVRIRMVNLREFTKDARRSTDDRPYGGGPGMVMLPEPLFDAVTAVRKPSSRVILMTPQGRRFNQQIAGELALENHLIFICGNYEGIDERVKDELSADELSIGDYVLTNGGLASVVVVDAVVRLLPDVLGCAASTAEESFSAGLLEYPQYTRPPVFKGRKVPDVLLSGDHEKIAGWRKEQALIRTKEKRPDLFNK